MGREELKNPIGPPLSSKISRVPRGRNIITNYYKSQIIYKYNCYTTIRQYLPEQCQAYEQGQMPEQGQPPEQRERKRKQLPLMFANGKPH